MASVSLRMLCQLKPDLQTAELTCFAPSAESCCCWLIMSDQACAEFNEHIVLELRETLDKL